MSPQAAFVRVWRRAILIALLAAQAAAQSAGNGAPVKPVRAPAIVEILKQLDTARWRENENEMRRLATRSAERARDNPKDAEAFFAAASAYNGLLNLYVVRNQKDRARKELDLAMDCVNRAIQLDSGRAESFALRAQLYGWRVGLANPFSRPFIAMGNAGKIKENLRVALRLEPDNPAVHLSFGMEDYYKPAAAGGSLPRAVEHFQKALQYDPENIDAWLWLGLTRKEQGKKPEARIAFLRVLELDPENVRAARELAALK